MNECYVALFEDLLGGIHNIAFAVRPQDKENYYDVLKATVSVFSAWKFIEAKPMADFLEDQYYEVCSL